MTACALAAAAASLPPPSLPGTVTVFYDTTFLVTALLGAFLVIPLLGGVFLRLWCGILDIARPPYARCWLAYTAAYVAAVLVAIVLLLLVKDTGRIPGWFLASLYCQGLAVHFVVVPLVLRTSWGKAIAAQALALVLYGAVLVIAMAPVIIHVRKAVDRAEWQADLEKLYSDISDYRKKHNGDLPAGLDELAKAGFPVLLLPGHQRLDVVYLPDYLRRTYPDLPPERLRRVIRAGGGTLKTPANAPLIWQDPYRTPGHWLHVCHFDGAIRRLGRPELQWRLERTLSELEVFGSQFPTTRPHSETDGQ